MIIYEHIYPYVQLQLSSHIWHKTQAYSDLITISTYIDTLFVLLHILFFNRSNVQLRCIKSPSVYIISFYLFKMIIFRNLHLFFSTSWATHQSNNILQKMKPFPACNMEVVGAIYVNKGPVMQRSLWLRDLWPVYMHESFTRRDVIESVFIPFMNKTCAEKMSDWIRFEHSL